MNRKRSKVNGLRVREVIWELLQKNVLGPNTFFELTTKMYENLNEWKREKEVFYVKIFQI